MDKQHVLVVEDDDLLLPAVQGILEAEGYIVHTATNGVKALQVMEKVHPDLIVADIMMPQMDGYAFYEVARARSEWLPIPFIFLSAKAEWEDVLKGKGLGAEDYITKPFRPEELIVTVRARLKRAQAIREASEAEFDQLKRQIIIMLSHELRTPLMAIVGYTEVALEDAPSLSPEAFQSYLMAIMRGADRLARLVKNMLLLVQLDTGHAAKEFHILSTIHPHLGDVIEHTVQLYRERATARGVTLEVNVEPNLPPIRLHETFFADALGRLVDNGIKFSRGEERWVTVSAHAVEGRVHVAVADQGVGIPADQIPHLFQRFRQIGREKMEQEGTGMGLAIARELICLHGGDISVESTLGQGSTFTIRLPRAEGE